MPTLARSTILFGAIVAAGIGVSASANATQPGDLAGPWTLSFDRTGTSCRVLLRSDPSDTSDHAIGMTPACRHAIPELAAAGRWAVPDDSHLTLSEPGGNILLAFVAAGDGYQASARAGAYRLTPVLSGRSVVGADVGVPDGAAASAPVHRVASRRTRGEESESPSDLAGRYAVMRDKRDTGCMVTLDKTHAKGGDRAQLAPGCRDQGIVIFDPTVWQIVRGSLVLTARAGHKTKLDKQDDGVWAKDPKEGGKPLGLKKL